MQSQSISPRLYAQITLHSATANAHTTAMYVDSTAAAGASAMPMVGIERLTAPVSRFAARKIVRGRVLMAVSNGGGGSTGRMRLVKRQAHRHSKTIESVQRA